MLEEFAAWYLAQWRDLLPERWRGAGADRAPVLLAVPDRAEAPTRFTISLRGQGTRGQGTRSQGTRSQGTRGQGRVDDHGHEDILGVLEPGVAPASLLNGRPRPAHVLLRVPAGQVLSRDVALPLAAERDPASVLAFEMDRLTPFGAAELRWGYAVTRRDRAAGRLLLRLSLVPRAAVESALVALAGLGLRADALEGIDADGARRRIPLAHDGGRTLRREQALAIGAWAAVAALAVFAIAVPFLRQGAALNAASHRIGELRPAVRQAGAIHARIAAATAGSDVLAAATRDTGDALTTLASLTAAMPDDTFLTDLSMAGRKVTINGQSAAAAKLIGVLSANPAWRNPTFASPVTRLETTRTDLFSIRAELAPRSELAP